MSLLELQRAVASGIMASLGRSTPERLAAKDHIKSNARMVRLEWAHIEAFDGAGAKPIGPEDLIEAEIRYCLQPHLTLIELRYPVEGLRIRVQDGAAGEEGCKAASNSQLRRKKRSIVL